MLKTDVSSIKVDLPVTTYYNIEFRQSFLHEAQRYAE
jgi:hypothetical protein